MRFFCVTSAHNSTMNRLLRAACRQRNVEIVTIDSEHLDFDFTAQPRPGSTDLLYRVSIIRRARDTEKVLLAGEPATFYASPNRALASQTGLSSLLAFRKAGVPTPKTIFAVPRDREKLAAAAAQLGGFPIILKVLGGSHGVGVMRLDSLPALCSVVGYLYTLPITFVLKEWIDTTSSARLIVLGNRVIDSIEYLAPADDFRSNVNAAPTVAPRSYPVAVRQAAVAATAACGIEFAGVDVLIGRRGRPAVLEVNMPCNFSRSQLATGVDIAGMMVDFLAAKAGINTKQTNKRTNIQTNKKTNKQLNQ